MSLIVKWLLPRLHGHWIHRAVRQGVDPGKTDRQLRFEWWLMTKSGSVLPRDSSWGFDTPAAPETDDDRLYPRHMFIHSPECPRCLREGLKVVA